MKLHVGFLFAVFFVLVTCASMMSKPQNSSTPVVEVKKEQSAVMTLVKRR